MINIGKEFSNVAFQNPAGFGVIFTYFEKIFLEFINSLVCALIVSAGI